MTEKSSLTASAVASILDANVNFIQGPCRAAGINAFKAQCIPPAQLVVLINGCDYDEYPECADDDAHIFRECVRENACLLPEYRADDYGADHHVNVRDYGLIFHVCGHVSVLLL